MQLSIAPPPPCADSTLAVLEHVLPSYFSGLQQLYFVQLHGAACSGHLPPAPPRAAQEQKHRGPVHLPGG